MAESGRLFNKNFFLLWQGQFVSQLGNQAHAIAMMFWLKHATGSAGVMGAVMMASMIPGVLLGPLGGTFADRYPRKRIIVISDIICGAAVLSLAAALFFMPEQTSFMVAWLTVVAVLLGAMSAVFRPAVSAAIPDLVPKDKVAAANSFNQSSFQISSLLGQGTGGILFRILGAPLLFLIDGVSYLLSAVSESFISIPQKMPEQTSGYRELFRAFKRDTAYGLRYIWKRAGMRNLFLTATVLNFFASPIIVLLPFFIEDHLLATPDWYGYLLAAIGGGSIVGYAGAGMLTLAGSRRAWSVILALAANGLIFSILGMAEGPLEALIIGFCLGILNGFVNINIITILQTTTPSEIRGRVFGLMGTISGGLMPIGMGLAGLVADLVHHNVPVIFMAAGGVIASFTLLISINRDFRNYLAGEPDTNAPDEVEEKRSP